MKPPERYRLLAESRDAKHAMEEQVLAVFAANPSVPFTPAVMARWLNLEAPCPWCPVGEPRKGEVCASVPVHSRELVARLLKSLLNQGKVTYDRAMRHGFYVLRRQ